MSVFFPPLWLRASLVAQMVKHLPTMQETRVQSLGQDDPLEREMATHSSVPAWKIPWTEEPGRLLSIGLQKSWTWLSNFTFFLYGPRGEAGLGLWVSGWEGMSDLLGEGHFRAWEVDAPDSIRRWEPSVMTYIMTRRQLQRSWLSLGVDFMEQPQWWDVLLILDWGPRRSLLWWLHCLARLLKDLQMWNTVYSLLFFKRKNSFLFQVSKKIIESGVIL